MREEEDKEEEGTDVDANPAPRQQVRCTGTCRCTMLRTGSITPSPCHACKFPQLLPHQHSLQGLKIIFPLSDVINQSLPTARALTPSARAGLCSSRFTGTYKPYMT
jgi:hypothetical protein